MSLSMLVTPGAAQAQPAKLARIGYLGPGSSTTGPHLREAFRAALRELGRVEGQGFVMEYRWAEGKLDRLPGLAADLTRLPVNLILAVGGPAAMAAKGATRTVPIVMVGVNDAVESGLVASLARPGGNLTGISVERLYAKRLELIKETVPRVDQVAVVWNPTNPANPTPKEIQADARALSLTLQFVTVRDPAEFDAAFGAIAATSRALLIFSEPAYWTHRQRLAQLALERKLPAVHANREFVEAGGLMSYSPSFADQYRRAAYYVDRIFKGARPTDLPVEQPTKFELVINRKTARALGPTIPPSVLALGPELIE